MGVKKTCSRCGRPQDEGLAFYKMKDGSRSDMCKKCETARINVHDPETFKWLLEKYDIPYSPNEWQASINQKKDPSKVTGGGVFGSYMARMKLNQWKTKCWADTDEIVAEEEKKKLELFKEHPELQVQEDNLKVQYARGEISEAEFKSKASMESIEKMNSEDYDRDPITGEFIRKEPTQQGKIDRQMIDLAADLTDEDRVYLALKWGKLYQPYEWIVLERLYTDFMNSFDIQGAARIDTLKKICKTSFKMDQAIDCGDADTYQKYSRVYDALMKSGKFTEAQRKEEKSGDFDCVGMIVNFAESNKGGGAIPRMKIATPHDKFDESIINMKKYNQNLFDNDSTIRNLLENWFKKKSALEQQNEDERKAKELGLDSIELTDEDMIESMNQRDADKEEDLKRMAGELD